MPPRLRNIPDDTIQRFVGFARQHRGVVPAAGILQKLVIFDFVAPLVESHPHGSILEIGAGLGFHSALLSRYGAVCATDLAAPGSFVGADRDVDLLRAAVLEALAVHPVSFSYNDGRSLPFDDAAFDIVFHNSVIEHVPDVGAFNREVRRILRPGGVCICITGTPALCRYRLVRNWLLMLPFHAAVAAYRETPVLREVTMGMLRVLGVSDGTRQRVRERLLRVDDRLRALAGSAGDLAGACPEKGLAKLYPRLFHYLYFPDYNRIVLDELARELGMSAGRLLACLEVHFGRLGSRLRFALTPQTHGQHVRNVRHEIAVWRIERWQERFREAGFTVEEVRGYRYHHLLELSPFLSWNTALYARAARWIHAAIDRRMFDPACASEIIMVARREA